ncbi:MAG: hypothetical protein R3175_07525 [Marinobacter sp.]|uniref:hypothetical protein n=1 Tax=Marinobacter sp. TaxID=50741 RepID=UPI00299F5055|nr:hypothetical protein [Marinobacter sp.]MDX1755890.1 hypothetical protein [Marinobacter sp.]
MKIIAPKTITSENLVSTTAESENHVTWEYQGISYPTEDQAIDIIAYGGDYIAWQYGGADTAGSYIYLQSRSLGTIDQVAQLQESNAIRDVILFDPVGDVKLFESCQNLVVRAISPDGAFFVLCNDKGIAAIDTGDLTVHHKHLYADPAYTMPEIMHKSYSPALSPSATYLTYAPTKTTVSVVDVATWTISKTADLTSLASGYDEGYITQTRVSDDDLYLFVWLRLYTEATNSWEVEIHRYTLSDDTITLVEATGSQMLYAFVESGFCQGSELIYISSASEPHTITRRDTGSLAVNSSFSVVGESFRTFRVSDSYIVCLFGLSPRVRQFSLTDNSEISVPQLAAPYLPRQHVFSLATEANEAVVGTDSDYRAYDLTVPEVLEPQTLTFSRYDRVIFGNDIYEVIVTTTSTRPDLGAALEPPEWLRIGRINPLRMFDGSIESVTTVDGDLDCSIEYQDLVDGLALFGVSAKSVQIQLIDPVDGVVFDTGALSLLDNTAVTDWYSYVYNPIDVRADFVYTALPPYRSATIRVVLTSHNGIAQVGEMVLGAVRKLGGTAYGTGVGILDFSRKERDTFGNFVITERSYSKRANYDLSVRTNQIAFIQQLLAKLRATPTVFIGAESQPETVVYGFYRGFDIVLEGPVYSDCTIEVEGLT